jgi:acyl dehydratase
VRATVERRARGSAWRQRCRRRRPSLDAEAIKRFASEFDPQPFHTDEAAAEDSFFGGLAASGWHTAAVTMRLFVDGGLPLAGGVIGGGGQIEWPRATRPGDVLQVESEVLEIRPSRSRPDSGWVTVRSETRNQDGEVVQVLTSQVLVFRRPTAQARRDTFPSG